MSRLVPLFPALFVLLWSTGFVGARLAMPHAEPFTFLAMRFCLAFLLLAPFAFFVTNGWPGRRAAMHAGIAGALIHGVYLGGVFFAIRHGLSAGIAALIVGLQPLLTTLFAALALGERIGRRQAAGLCIGLVGLALVVAPKIGTGSGSAVATFLPAAVAALAISIGTIWQKRFVGGVDLRVGTAIQYAGAFVPTLAAAFLFETMRVEWTGELFFALGWLTLVLSIGAIFLLLFLIREGAVSQVSSLMYLTPGVTAVMTFLLFGDSLAPIQLVGMVLAGLGVAAVAWKPARVATPPSDPI